MAKPTKASGKVSAGIHSTVSSKIIKAIRKEYPQSADRVVNQLAAHKKGKKVVVTIDNPNKNETNKKRIKVLASTIWKDPKYAN